MMFKMKTEKRERERERITIPYEEYEMLLIRLQKFTISGAKHQEDVKAVAPDFAILKRVRDDSVFVTMDSVHPAVINSWIFS